MDNLQCIEMDDLALLLDQIPPQRRITSVHLHHTGNPGHAQWRGEASLRAMRDLHVRERGLPAIAQHLTIDPTGALWLGRDWDLPPASCATPPPGGGAHNGNDKAGPFMIMLVGNFDDRCDKLAGEQEESLALVLALLGQAAGSSLPIHTHAEMDKQAGGCPGTSLTHNVTGAIDKNVLASLNAIVAKQGLPPRRKHLPLHQLPPRVRELVAARRARSAPVPIPTGLDTQEIPEDFAARSTTVRLARGIAGIGEAAARGAIDPAYAPLFGHVLNSARGLLLESAAQAGKAGQFFTSQDELAGSYFLALDQYERALAPGQPLRVLIYAHGGLNDEGGALDHAAAHLRWWKDVLGIFPFFMVWETGFLEELLRNKRELPDDARGLFSSISDWIIEKGTGAIARELWDRMKANAQLCSAADWHAVYRTLDDDDPPSYVPRGVAGAARLFALALCERLAGYAQRKRPVEIHAIGHSAGAIYHTHFLPMLTTLIGERRLDTAGVTVKTLHLLAPAVRIDAFEERLAPIILGGDVGQAFIYTMDDKRERDDDVVTIYRKSLLYFVDEACERNNPGILGMEKYLKKRRAKVGTKTNAVFAPGDAGPGRVDYSNGGKGAGPHVTVATEHGKFDNDPVTMNSVAARILGTAPASEQRYERWIGKHAGQAGKKKSSRETPVITRATAAADYAGRRIALCVGIDDYPTAPLLGCVNDSRRWGAALQECGFSVSYLHDSQATRAGLLEAIGSRVGALRAGDWLVIQISSHGTTLPDKSGDEAADQAIVPWDYRSNGLLVDDELGQVLSALPSGAHLSLFADHCNSRSASRFAIAGLSADGTQRRPRYLPADAQMRQLHAQQRAAAGAPAKRAATVPWLHLAACQDDEYAYETGDSGDFTRVAVPLLKTALANGWSAGRFLGEVRRSFPPGSRQNPDLMPGCDSDQLLLPGARGHDAVAAAAGLQDIAALLEQAAGSLRRLGG